MIYTRMVLNFLAIGQTKEKRRRRSRPAIEEFSDLDSENFEIFYPDIIN